MRANRAENFWKKITLFPQFYDSKGRIIYFLSRREQFIIYIIFKVRIFISKKYQPPPLPQNQMVGPLIIIDKIWYLNICSYYVDVTSK